MVNVLVCLGNDNVTSPFYLLDGGESSLPFEYVVEDGASMHEQL